MTTPFKATKFTNPDALTPAMQIQETTTTKEASMLKDSDFMTSAFFKLQNSIYANSMFVDQLENLSQCNLSKCIDSVLNPETFAVEIKEGYPDAQFVSTMQTGEFNTAIDDFTVFDNAFIPEGGAIEYYLTTDDSTYYPVPVNTNGKPLRLGLNKGTGFRIKIVLRANAQGVSPQLFGYAVLFFDEMVDLNYGLTNPDLTRFDTVESGSVTLIRDRTLDDKIVRVISEGSITEMYYSLEGELINVITNNGKAISNTIMEYGNYFNSQNKNERVLLGIKTVPVSVEDILDPNKIFEGGEGQ